MTFKELAFVAQPSDVIAFPPEMRTAIEAFVTISMTSVPATAYLNVKPPRHRGFNGFAQIMTGANVAETVQLEFMNQQILHWRDSQPIEFDHRTCILRELVGSSTPGPSWAPRDIPLVRQPWSSIRIKTVSGHLCVVSLKWEEWTSRCGNTPLVPPPEQGNAPTPKNDRSGLTERPDSTRSDPADRSPNDGDGTDANNPNAPPSPTGLQPQGRWWFVSQTTTFPACEVQTFTTMLPYASDPAIRPVWEPRQPNAACPEGQDGAILYNGQEYQGDGVVSADFFFF